MVDLINYSISLGIVVISFILSYIIIFIIEKLSHFTSKTKTTLDDEIIIALKFPIKLIFILIGSFFAVYRLNPNLRIDGISLDVIFIILAIFLGAFTLVRILKGIFSWYSLEIMHKTNTKIDKTLIPFLKKSIAIIIYVIALLIILDKLGIEIGPLLAGLGIAGLAVALALQDTLSNIFSAVYIAADRPIKIGDYIQLESGEKGYVEDISWRSTKIRTLPNNLIILPNSRLAQAIITNYDSPQAEMSLVIPVSVSYKSDLEKVEKITIKAAKKIQSTTEGAIKDFEPFIRYNEFGDSSINLSVILRIKTFVDQYMVKHYFIKELFKLYNKNKIEIPFPQRDVHLKK